MLCGCARLRFGLTCVCVYTGAYTFIVTCADALCLSLSLSLSPSSSLPLSPPPSPSLSEWARRAFFRWTGNVVGDVFFSWHLHMQVDLSYLYHTRALLFPCVRIHTKQPHTQTLTFTNTASEEDGQSDQKLGGQSAQTKPSLANTDSS